ncbi:fungal-specific transcription factor domain-containing protein [Schizophyllum amplum]|uniref:Fungal-specific transcription factor domain-containing protein n=1 Tax=Schizophyllum amplum TaxID=97359 RepID=A0A550CYM5_9AGAR|nr:fungal-specific transcription factor domain-containing protein [Auriculariopsis ampla]
MRASTSHHHAPDAASTSSLPVPPINTFAALENERRADASQSPEYVADSLSSKRRKLDRACDACRRRKTRCDGPSRADNVCSTCLQANKSCTYLESSKPRGPPKAYITGLEDRLDRIESLLKRLRPDIDVEAEFGPPIPRDSWRTETSTSRDVPRKSLPPSAPPSAIDSPKDRRHVSSSAAEPSSTARTYTRPGNMNMSDTESNSGWYSADVDDTIEDVGGGVKLSLPGVDDESNRNSRFIGRSSGAPWIEAARKLRDLHIAESGQQSPAESTTPASAVSAETQSSLRRQEYWVSPDWELANEGHKLVDETLAYVQDHLPPPDLSLSLIDLYFAYTNTHIPLLHRPTFERQWRSGLYRRNQWFAAVCFAIFAVASRWSDDLRVLPESCVAGPDGPTWHAAGSLYFQLSMYIVKRHRSVIYPPCLHEIQLFTVQAMFMRGTHWFGSSWLYTSVGVVKAQDVGAHRKSIYSNIKATDRELWKRAWWCLVLFDRLDSASFGKPCSTREEDFDVDLLLEVDDEYWETGDPETDFKQPRGKPSKVTAFNLVIKLSSVIARTLRTVYSLDKTNMPLGPYTRNLDPVITQLNTALTEWVESVPDHLKPSRIDDPTFANQAATLFTTYYFTQMLIYRPFIPRPPTPAHPYSPSGPYPAAAICLNAAKACVGIIQQQLPNGYTNVPNLLTIAHLAAGTLLFGWWELKARERTVVGGVEDVKPNVTVMDQMMAHIRVAMQALEWASPRWPRVELLLNHLRSGLPSEDMNRRAERLPMVMPMKDQRTVTPRIRANSLASATREDMLPTPMSAPAEWSGWQESAGRSASTRPLAVPLRRSSDVPPATYTSRQNSTQQIVDRLDESRSYTDDARNVYLSPSYAASPGTSYLSPWSDTQPYAGPRSASPVDMEETERPVAISALRRSASRNRLNRHANASSAKFNESYARGLPASNMRGTLQDSQSAAFDRRASLASPNLLQPTLVEPHSAFARHSFDVAESGRASPYDEYRDRHPMYEPLPAFEEHGGHLYDKPRLQVQTTLDTLPGTSAISRAFEKGRYGNLSPAPPMNGGYAASPVDRHYEAQDGSWMLPSIAARGHQYANYRPASAYPGNAPDPRQSH